MSKKTEKLEEEIGIWRTQSRFKKTKEFMSRLWHGEMRGALAYVIPSPSQEMPSITESKSDCFHERFLQKTLNSLACRRWGHDYGIPMIQPHTKKYGGVLWLRPLGHNSTSNIIIQSRASEAYLR